MATIVARSNHSARLRWVMVAIAIVLTCCLSIATTRAESPQRPYDTELFRLAENLGGIHYLGALCGRADGQSWRMHMQQLIDSEGSTALRRALLARRFNQGYRNYSRTYRTCSETAKAALSRFIGDAQVLTGRILAYAKPPETPEAPETK